VSQHRRVAKMARRTTGTRLRQPVRGRVPR